MAHILVFIVIALIKIIKWLLIKSRLFIVAIPMAMVIIFSKEWCDKNEYFFEALGIALIAIV